MNDNRKANVYILVGMSDVLTRVYILVGMSDVLTTHFEHVKIANDILDVIKFESSLDLNKQKVLSDLLNTKMLVGSSMVDHILKMIEYI